MSLPSVEISSDEALAADVEAFPLDPQPGRVETIASGASGRKFFRILRGTANRVLMAYPDEPRENHFFTGIGKALHENGIPVPQILAASPNRGMVWLEDLGEIDLYSLRSEATKRFRAYSQALSALHSIQNLPSDIFSEAGIETHTPFDEPLYRFEHQYFENELLGRLDPGPPLGDEVRGEMDRLLERLLEPEPTWVHRDFQSKNLMLDASDQLRIVDFQGIRRGHRYYDLASLLYDPYVNLPRAEREDLFQIFCRMTGRDATAEQLAFSSACCQRLMQALGAFGRFGIGQQVEFFREKIPVGLALLEECARNATLPGLAQTAANLKRITERG